MFDCCAMSGSLNPSRYGPYDRACASEASVTDDAPQIIGTNDPEDGVVTPECCVDQV